MFTNFSVGADNRAVEVFLDRKRLQKGRRFQSDFAAAVTHSHIAVPVISTSALERLYDHSPDVVDNVLMEWIIILECAAAKRLHKVYPIVFARAKSEWTAGEGAESANNVNVLKQPSVDFFAEF